MYQHSQKHPPGGTALSTPELPVLADAAYYAIVAAIARAIASVLEAPPVALLGALLIAFDGLEVSVLARNLFPQEERPNPGTEHDKLTANLYAGANPELVFR